MLVRASFDPAACALIRAGPFFLVGFGRIWFDLVGFGSIDLDPPCSPRLPLLPPGPDPAAHRPISNRQPILHSAFFLLPSCTPPEAVRTTFSWGRRPG